MNGRRATGGSTAWAWIVVGGVVALVLFVVAVIGRRQSAQAVTPVAKSAAEGTSGAASVPAPVEQYLKFAAATKDRLHGGTAEGVPRLTRAHDYSAEGLRQLADALAAAEGPSAASVSQSLRADADELQRDQKSLRHADIVKDAFGKVADVVGRRMPDEGRRLRDLASAINPDRPLLEQRDAVQELFIAAGDAVRQMTSPS
jgi:hypothetical protein